MREQFPWFFDPTEEELQRLWDEATFSFDANVLLNLYRVDRETTEDYFKIFRAFGDRIFLPHEAANQFFQNRRSVIRTEQNSFDEAKEQVEDWVERRFGFADIKQQLSGDIGQIIEDEIEGVFEDREDYENEIEAVRDDLIQRIEDLEKRFTPTGTTRANVEQDEILGDLMDIFGGSTGSELDEDIEDLKDEARKRYEREQPPGYEDYDGDDDLSRGECEDYFIWKQLMVYAGREDEDVIFITDDGIADKGRFDWWEKDNKYDIVRPRHELLREFRRETGQTFWMLTTEEMIDDAGERLGLDVKEKSIKQTGKVSKGKEIFIENKDVIKDYLKRIERLSFKIENIETDIDKENWKTVEKKMKEKSRQVLDIIYDAEKNVAILEEHLASDFVEEHANGILSAIRQKEKSLAKSGLDTLVEDLRLIASMLREEKNKMELFGNYEG